MQRATFDPRSSPPLDAAVAPKCGTESDSETEDNIDDASKASSEAETDEDEEPVASWGRKRGREPRSNRAAKAAAKAAAADAAEAHRAKLAEAALDAFTAMEYSEQQAYIKECFLKNSPIERAIKQVVNKSRSDSLSIMLKNELYNCAPELVPNTSNVKADMVVYKASKKPFDDMGKYMCSLFAVAADLADGPSGPCFLPFFDDEEPAHGFTKYVHRMAAHADIKRKDIQDNFIGFLAYSAGMVADYGLKTRGKGAGHAMVCASRSRPPCAAPRARPLLRAAPCTRPPCRAAQPSPHAA